MKDRAGRSPKILVQSAVVTYTNRYAHVLQTTFLIEYIILMLKSALEYLPDPNSLTPNYYTVYLHFRPDLRHKDVKFMKL